MNAKHQLDTFCEDIKNICLQVIETFREKVDSHIETVCSSASDFGPMSLAIKSSLSDCQNVSDMFLPIDQLASIHKDTVCLDKAIAKTKTDLIIPQIDSSKDSKDRDHVEKSIQNILIKFCEPSLSEKIFATKVKERKRFVVDEFIPTLLQSICQAVLENDLETVKTLVENAKLPPKSITYILNYNFNCSDDDGGFRVLLGTEAKVRRYRRCSKSDSKVIVKEPVKIPSSLFTLAAIHDRLDIFRYFISVSGINLLERYAGKTVAHHLVSTKKMSSDAEKLLEELLQKEPKLLEIADERNISLFQYAIIADLESLCRMLVREHGSDLNGNFNNGSTPLITAIRMKNKRAFDQLVALGASLTATSTNLDTTLHQAIKVDWDYAFNIILPKHPEMLGWKNINGHTPCVFMAAFDSVNAFKAMGQWANVNKPQKGIPTMEDVYNYITHFKAEKLSSFLK